MVILSVATSCAYNAKKLTPHFIDFNNWSCRKYKVVDDDPKVVFEYVEELHMSECDGFIALPLDQALDIKNYYEEYKRKEKDNSVERDYKSLTLEEFNRLSQRQKERYLLDNIYPADFVEPIHIGE